MVSWTTACPDWRERVGEGRSIIPVGPLFPEEADAASAIFDDLILKDVAGQPRIGDVSRPWFKDFARTIFGAYNPETGQRLIQNFFLCVAKKNAKSTLAAAVMLTALMRNWRESGEFYILAPTLEIANNSYIPIRDFVRADPELSEILHVQDHIKTVTHRGTKAFLKVLAADSETVGGKKGIGIFVDELWQFGKKANAGSMLVEAIGGLAARPEGFVVYATTHSDAPPEGVYLEKLKYFRDVRDGKVDDPNSLPLIYEFPPEIMESKPYLDRSKWHIPNPNLGSSVSEKWLENQLREKQRIGEHAVRDFVSKHFNVEVGQSLRADRWAGADYWEEKVESAITLENLIETSDVVTIGIDGGGLDDLLAVYVVGREKAPDKDIRFRRWFGWGHAWAFSDPVKKAGVLERRLSEVSKLRDFERAGELTIFTRMGDDVEGVVEICKQVFDSGKLAHIGLDPVGVGALVDAINDAGICADEGAPEIITAVSQGYRLTGAVKTAERKLVDGTFVPAAQGIVSWAVGNAKNEQRGNAIVITKQASGYAKIDPLMAMFDAVELMSRNPEAGARSVYEDHGPRFV